MAVWRRWEGGVKGVILFFITVSSSTRTASHDPSDVLASSCEVICRISPARLVYRKLRATMANGMAGNRVPTAMRLIRRRHPLQISQKEAPERAEDSRRGLLCLPSVTVGV